MPSTKETLPMNTRDDRIQRQAKAMRENLLKRRQQKFDREDSHNLAKIQNSLIEKSE